MVIKETVAFGIVSSIADLRKGNDLEDFTVIVEDVSVKCHRFILAACSQFFRGLLRTDMQEGKENCAELKEMSHCTFTTILTALYTGVDVLTRENVIDIWHATHFLQIEFMVRECEDFVIEGLSLEDYQDIYHHAKMLDSKRVFSSVQSFMLKNFDVVAKSQLLPELPFDELIYLVKSDDLVVSSEDRVVEAVLRWVSHVPATNDVKKRCAEASQKNFTDKEITSKDALLDDNDDDVDDDGDDDDGDDDDDDDANGLQSTSCDTNKDIGEQNTMPGSTMEALPADIDQDRTDRTGITGCPSQQKKRICRGVQEMPSSVPRDDATVEPSGTHSANNVLPQNEREKHLPELISATRLCLASPKCLETLLRDPNVLRYDKAKEKVIDAVSYQMQVGRRHGQWPEAARHRRHSEFENVMIWTSVNFNWTKVYSFVEQMFFEIDTPDIPTHRCTHDSTSGYSIKESLPRSITSYNNKPYIITSENIYEFSENSWLKKTNGPGYTSFPVSCESCIYLLGQNSRQARKMNPENPKTIPFPLPSVTPYPGPLPITSAMSFAEAILVFSDENTGVDGQLLTCVHCFDTNTETWTRLDNITGPAENLISFRNDTHTYLLQTNGNLWTVSSNETSSVEITFSQKLWDFRLELYCAVFFGDVLFIGCVLTGQHASRQKSITGIAKRVRYINFESTKLRLAPLIMPKKYFRPQQDLTVAS